MSKYRFEFSDKWWAKEKEAGALESPEAFLEYDDNGIVIRRFFEVPQVISFIENNEWEKAALEWTDGVLGDKYFGKKQDYVGYNLSYLIGFLKLLGIDIVPYLDDYLLFDKVLNGDIVEVKDE